MSVKKRKLAIDYKNRCGYRMSSHASYKEHCDLVDLRDYKSIRLEGKLAICQGTARNQG